MGDRAGQKQKLATEMSTERQMYDVLIRGGELIYPAGERYGAYDVAISAGLIAAIAPDLPASAARETVDAQGQYVTPGLVDLHTHCYWGATYWGSRPIPLPRRLE